MNEKNSVNLSSEQRTARDANVNINVLRRYRQLGRIKPVHELAGVSIQYDGDEVRRFFQTDPEYLANRARISRRVIAA